MCEIDLDADPYGELDGAVKRFIARSRTSNRSALEVGDAIVRTQLRIDALRLELARDAAHFATTDEWERQGFRTPIAWLTNECHMTPGEAGAAICVGDQADSLQPSVEAMSAGRVGFAHLVLLARTAEAVRESGAQFDQLRLLRKAEAQSPHRFRRDCAHARHAADAAAYRKRQQQCADERFLEVRSLGGDDGGVWMKGFIDNVGGATLRAALEPLARRMGADDDRPRGRRLADALVEMAAYTLNTGGQEDTVSAADVRHVVHWAHGGVTEDGSLVLLCFKHHDDVHLRGWQIVRVAGEREVLVIPPVPFGDPSIRGPARHAVA